jgi:tetratricopeptide (TPR) repeat protein
MLGHMYAFKGEYPEARACYEELASNEDASIRAEARTDLALIPMFQGRLAEADKMLDRLIADDKEENVGGIHLAEKLMLKASICREIGDLDGAVRQTRAQAEALETTYAGEQMKCEASYAALLAEGGHVDAAEETAESLRVTIENKDARQMFLYWEALGAIDAAVGDYDAAIEHLHKALDGAPAPIFGARCALAGAYLEAGRLGEAVDELEGALSRYDEARALTPISSVKAHYLLGLAFERSGWAGKAVEQYDRFLEIWKNADPGIASVDDARERLKRLKASS